MSLNYIQRLGLLCVFVILISTIDYLIKGEKATRWKDYGFVLSVAIFGGCFGALFDQISVSISPEFFQYGKNLGPFRGFELRQRVAGLGFQAGFFAAILLAMILIYRTQSWTPRPFAKLYRASLWPVAFALFCAPFGCFAGQYIDPLNAQEAFGTFLGKTLLIKFRSVQVMHLSLYLGALIGFGCGLWKLGTQPQNNSSNSTPELGSSDEQATAKICESDLGDTDTDENTDKRPNTVDNSI